jgi:hypothetical protein
MKYVNEDNFSNSSKVKTPFNQNQIDKEILKDKSSYRVYESYRGFVNGRSSYFHNSISGYHAAKPKRMQNIYDFYLSKNKSNVLNMLNVKYIVDLNESNSLSLKTNEQNLGDAWFVENIIEVENENDEILLLDKLNYSKDCLSRNLKNKSYNYDDRNSVELISRKSNELIYKISSKSVGFIVFSEAFYSNGWKSFINEKPIEHHKVNYLLRGMEVPQGEYIIRFEFDPNVIRQGSAIMLSFNFILLILIGLYFKKELKNV